MKTFKLNPPIVILATDGLRSDQAVEAMLNSRAKGLIGAYKGEKEQSLMFRLPTSGVERERALRVATFIGRQCEQECILYSDEYRNTFLINCETEESTPIGVFKEVSKRKARASGNYTYDPSTGKYWMAS